MISLKDYRGYWTELGTMLGFTSVMAITIDKEMSKKIQGIKKGDAVLFWLPPAAKSDNATFNNFTERNSCVVFVMEKYDPQREGSLDVLERTQPMAENVKAMLVDAALTPCSPLKVELTSLDTLPETDFYGTLAGWSIGFRIITD